MLTINGINVAPQAGETIIETARRVGIHIPSLCYAKGAQHKASCMVCAVKNMASGQLLPACSTRASEGLSIDTVCEEVVLTRTLSLELLLSDHRADCEAPCAVACPAGFDVAAMNRLYDAGKIDEAIAHLRHGLVIPATLCFLCPAPCERVCRRGDLSEAVPIREVKKRIVAQTDIAKVARPAANGKRVAVLGANAAGISAAYHLRSMGYEVQLLNLSELEKMEAQHTEVPSTLRFELRIVEATGVELVDATAVDVAQLSAFNGVVAAAVEPLHPAWIAPATKSKQPARLVLEGRRMAEALHRQLAGTAAESAAGKAFCSTYPRFSEVEKRLLAAQLREREASRSTCLYCDCDRKTSCRLRDAATECSIRTPRYDKHSAASPMLQQKIGAHLRFEPAKCIRCGLCVYNTTNGFTFAMRGFAMQVVLPNENVPNVSPSIADICPTGALWNSE